MRGCGWCVPTRTAARSCWTRASARPRPSAPATSSRHAVTDPPTLLAQLRRAGPPDLPAYRSDNPSYAAAQLRRAGPPALPACRCGAQAPRRFRIHAQRPVDLDPGPIAYRVFEPTALAEDTHVQLLSDQF